jgi:hypothetical protein
MIIHTINFRGLPDIRDTVMDFTTTNSEEQNAMNFGNDWVSRVYTISPLAEDSTDGFLENIGIEKLFMFIASLPYVQERDIEILMSDIYPNPVSNETVQAREAYLNIVFIKNHVEYDYNIFIKGSKFVKQKLKRRSAGDAGFKILEITKEPSGESILLKHDIKFENVHCCSNDAHSILASFVTNIDNEIALTEKAELKQKIKDLFYTQKKPVDSDYGNNKFFIQNHFRTKYKEDKRFQQFFISALNHIFIYSFDGNLNLDDMRFNEEGIPVLQSSKGEKPIHELADIDLARMLIACMYITYGMFQKDAIIFIPNIDDLFSNKISLIGIYSLMTDNSTKTDTFYNQIICSLLDKNNFSYVSGAQELTLRADVGRIVKPSASGSNLLTR